METRRIAIDIGYCNTKIYYKNKDKVIKDIFPSKLSENLDNQFGKDVMKSDGKSYIVGFGEYKDTDEKHKRDNLPFILASVCKVLEKVEADKNNETINVVIGLPIDEINSRKQVLEQLKNKEYLVEYNSNEYKFKIKNTAAIAEGYAGSLTYAKNVSAYSVIDIGGGTINYLTIVDNKIITSGTLRFGILNLYNEIYKLMPKERGISSKDDIEEALKVGLISKDKIASEKRKFVKKIDESLKCMLADTVFVTGGGAWFLTENENTLEELRDFTEKEYKVTDEPVFDNVIGIDLFGQDLWKGDDVVE